MLTKKVPGVIIKEINIEGLGVSNDLIGKPVLDKPVRSRHCNTEQSRMSSIGIIF